jgi:aminoglycoside/choline kinase family phosphotransferase
MILEIERQVQEQSDIDFAVKISWKELISKIWNPEEIDRVVRITGGGSDREFYRLFKNKSTLILMEYSSNSEGLRDYVDIGEFYHSHKIPVPQIYEFCKDKGIAILEDMGDISVNSKVQPLLLSNKEGEIIELYSKIIKQLVSLQTIPKDVIHPLISSRKFDYLHYRWETDYFREKCCGTRFNIKAIQDESLGKELGELANSLINESQVIVHRDFQSQNICLYNGEVYFIDFQSARMGSRFYDLASLLRDPYVELSENIHDSLFYVYIREITERTSFNLSKDEARDIYNRVSLQRLMQALGAYGNLGVCKGKTHFLEYIPPALSLLKRILKSMDKSKFSNLKSLVDNLYNNIIISRL